MFTRRFFSILCSLALLGGYPLVASADVQSIAVGSLPNDFALDTRNNHLFTANSGSHDVTVFTEALSGTRTITQDSVPFALAVNPGTSRVYVANAGSDNLAVLDAFANTITYRDTGSKPLALALDSQSGNVYVVNQGSNSVTVLDAFGHVSTAVKVGDKPIALDFNSATRRAYVANSVSNSVSVIDTFAHTGTGSADIYAIIDTVNVGNRPVAIKSNPATGKIYVANQNSNTVSIIDASSHAVETLPVGASPTALALDGGLNRVYVANITDNNISVLDGGNNFTISVGAAPSAIAVNLLNHRVYVANYMDNSLSIIDGDKVVETVKVGSHPVDVIVNPTTARVYVLNQGSNSVSAISECKSEQLLYCTNRTLPSCGEAGGFWNGNACLSGAPVLLDLGAGTSVQPAGLGSGARFSGVLVINGASALQTAFMRTGEHVSITLSMDTEASDVGQNGEFLIVVKYIPNDALPTFYMRNPQGVFEHWDFSFANLRGATATEPLVSKKTVEVFNGPLNFPGRFIFFCGYRLAATNTIIFNGLKQLELNVSASSTP